MFMKVVAFCVASGLACPVALRYFSTNTFGAKLIMFCSPQPRGIRISSSRPLIDGTRRSPGKQVSPLCWMEQVLIYSDDDNHVIR